MARYDKYEPKGGGFRAPVAEELTSAQVDTLIAVGLDTNGRLVVGAGETGIIGVIAQPRVLQPGQIADVMTNGDIVDVDDMAPGSTVYAAADGTVGTTGGAGSVLVGFVVGDRNGPRLVVRVGQAGAA